MYRNFNLPAKDTKIAEFISFLFACFVGNVLGLILCPILKKSSILKPYGEVGTVTVELNKVKPDKQTSPYKGMS